MVSVVELYNGCYAACYYAECPNPLSLYQVPVVLNVMVQSVVASLK